jgi:hypothetical protein
VKSAIFNLQSAEYIFFTQHSHSLRQIQPRSGGT